ncbi:MAG: efflux RND transporter permease subunit [Crocinitomicaceae bacterium]|jgi:hydrophobe/amphiphile efflux-1 (HAE1) family protein|nr:efflux RND transporter permease subunit [Crocinitomicaceae bacterium]MBK9593165.1 efflux RND transporter permease subunit [Crocinitomicaceae bacterium]
MTLSELSIKRPVLATVFAIVVVLLGSVAYLSLGVREYPSVDPPVVTVTTNYPGANAEIIESQITEPLEEQINSVEGVKKLSSISTDGRSTITIEFLASIDLNDAANDVRDKVSQAVRNLPPDADPPIVNKADANSETILSITVQSKKRDLLDLTQIGNNIFKERLQTIPGVSSIRIWGEKKYAMRLELDPVKMRELNVTPLDIQAALNTQNIELPSGRIEGTETELTVRTVGLLQTPEQFENLVIGQFENTLIRLKDVGTVRLGAEVERSLLRGNGVIPMIGIALQPQPGSNYIDIVDEAFRRLEIIKKDLPEDIELNVARDLTISIRHAIKEVQSTILLAFLLVLVVIFLFLRNWRTTLIPIILIPISLIGTFAALYLAGFSINILSLLGLVLATGLVVDDAIVVMENIYSKIEEGMHPMKAAFEGSREVFFAVVATSVTLICVFLPIFFMSGLTGQLFREFAMVVVSSIVISTFITLSLTPMMSSRMLKKSKKENALMRFLGRVVDGGTQRYTSTLKTFMKRRWLAIPIFALMLVSVFVIGSFLHSELAPMEDKNQLRIVSTAPEGTSFEAMDNYQENLMKTLDTIPEKAFLLGVTSPTFRASTAANSSFVFMTLKPADEREKSQAELAEELNAILKKMTFAQSFVVQEPTIQAGGGGSGSLPIQYVLQAPDLNRLKAVLPIFMDSVQSSPVFSASTVDLKFNKPELVLTINRDKALLMGVNVADIAMTLQTFLSDQRMGYFMKDGKQYYILAQANREKKNDPADLNNITVRNNSGQMITLDNLVDVELQSRPPSLLRYNRYTSATVQASPAEGYTLGDGIEEMDRIADQVLDESFSTELSGSAADFAESSDSTSLIFVFALVLVYLTLAAQFESFRDPLIIMLTVPLALAGAIFTLWIFDQTLNIFSQIGMIVLIGIVTKNGILIVEFANQKRDAGMSLRDAAFEAASQRFRPILMTSLSTVLGALPIALALGGSSTSRVPMGLAIIGGLLISLVLTLYIIPALYTYIASKENKIIDESDYQ